MLRDFGFVTLIDLTVSLLGVLLVLPAVLVLRRARGRARGPARALRGGAAGSPHSRASARAARGRRTGNSRPAARATPGAPPEPPGPRLAARSRSGRLDTSRAGRPGGRPGPVIDTRRYQWTIGSSGSCCSSCSRSTCSPLNGIGSAGHPGQATRFTLRRAPGHQRAQRRRQHQPPLQSGQAPTPSAERLRSHADRARPSSSPARATASSRSTRCKRSQRVPGRAVRRHGGRAAVHHQAPGPHARLDDSGRRRQGRARRRRLRRGDLSMVELARPAGRRPGRLVGDNWLSPRSWRARSAHWAPATDAGRAGAD